MQIHGLSTNLLNHVYILAPMNYNVLLFFKRLSSLSYLLEL